MIGYAMSDLVDELHVLDELANGRRLQLVEPV